MPFYTSVLVYASYPPLLSSTMPLNYDIWLRILEFVHLVKDLTSGDRNEDADEEARLCLSALDNISFLARMALVNRLVGLAAYVPS